MGLTHVVLGLLLFVSLLVSSSLGLIWCSLLLGQGLPLVSEDLADLTKADTRILFSDGISLVVGEEHISRETSLGRIGICDWHQRLVVLESW